MSFDRMLLWLSAKGQGSWPQFRSAVETCSLESDLEDGSAADGGSDLPVYQEARLTLQRLGHAEFHAGAVENAWRIVPPTVAVHGPSSDAGVLCGARLPVLLDPLITDARLTVVRTQITGMPERIVVRGTCHEQLIARVLELGFFVQRDAPVSLLSVLPTVRDHSRWDVSVMPETPGWVVHRFALRPEPHWVEVAQLDALRASSGLFRFVMKHQRFYYLQRRGQTFSVPVQEGKYGVMQRRRGTLKYDRAQKTLSVPAAMRPPLLVERALVLCSGALPQFDTTTRRLKYLGVDDKVALLVGQLLHQEIG